MALKDLIPWRKRGRDVEVRREEERNPVSPGHDVDVYRREERNPLPSLLHEMDRLFDDAFRGFDLMPFGSDRAMNWPNIQVSETDQEVKVTADVRGLEESDLQLGFANGVLAIKGEKKSVTEDESRRFSERYYGRFEQRIPIDGIDENKVAATLNKGVLTVVLPKRARVQGNEGFI
jgi:HSP20 family protein